MKKLINKLFEWLGYVPKKYEVLTQDDFIENLHPNEHKINKNKTREPVPFSALLDDPVIALIRTDMIVYDVIGWSDKVEVWMFGIAPLCLIKSFPFGDDKEYAKLCAEELCEKLNERI